MNVKKTVLIVEDEEVNHLLLEKILGSQYSTIEAVDGIDGLNKLEENAGKIDIVLLDLVMPRMGGYEFLEKKAHISKIASVPVIVVTQSDREEDEVEALRNGAVEFLIKPYRPEIIRFRIEAILNMVETAALINVMERDSLTGQYNKEAFYRFSEDTIRENPNISFDIFCLDIVGFKLINDMFGPEEGDKVLKYVAGILQAMCPEKNALVCRSSGDVFYLLAPHSEGYLERLDEELVQQLSVYPLGYNVTIKLGVYPITDRTMSSSAMCDRARMTVDRIKGDVRQHFAYYDAEQHAAYLEEMQLISESQGAVERGEFVVYYQPKYDLETEELSGAEALVRWQHPTRGFLPPSKFIPLFEKNGFITILDVFVWQEVCRTIRKWMDKGNRSFPVSVNVSRVDIYNPHLKDIILGLLRKYSLKPSMLHLEITESTYTENSVQLIKVINSLKEAGFYIEMDDFGSGYSSLNMLNEVPVDCLKLDIAFLQNNKPGMHGGSILNFVINLAKWMGLSVIAEGIETKEQVLFLRSISCTSGQGYFFSRPLPQRDFEDLMIHSSVAEEKMAKLPSKPMIDLNDMWSPGSRFNQLFNDFVGALIIVELEERHLHLVRANEEFYLLLDTARKKVDLVSDNIMEAVYPEDRVRLLDSLKEASQTGRSIECRVRRQDLKCGKILRDFRVKVKRINNMAGMCYYFASIDENVPDSALTRKKKEDIVSGKGRSAAEQPENDAKTNLLTRNSFKKKAEDILQRPYSENVVNAFIIADIDGLSGINELYGRATGDAAIAFMGSVIRENLRAGDAAGCIDRNDFAFLLTDVHSEAVAVARSTAISRIFSARGTEKFQFPISCSMGIAMFPVHGRNYNTLVMRAEQAMYAAKNSGKNMCLVYEPDPLWDSKE